MTDHDLISRLTAALSRALDVADLAQPDASPAPGLDEERALLASLTSPRRVRITTGHVRHGLTGTVTTTQDTDHGPVCTVHLDDGRVTYVPARMLVDVDAPQPVRTVETVERMEARLRAKEAAE